MLKINVLLPLFICLAFSRCGVLKNDVDINALPDGEFRANVFGVKGKVYVENRNDSLVVYQLTKIKGNYVADSLRPVKRYFAHNSDKKLPSLFYSDYSLDIDALTIPFKYRPEARTLPRQFTTSLNGAAYVGFRRDIYRIKYRKHFFRYFERESRHYAISVGAFTGFGSTAMNPWVTDYKISSEYEGVVWLKGGALIMAVGRFTSGVSIAWDSLLDANRKYWIYEKKPWIGLVFGLNLN